MDKKPAAWDRSVADVQVDYLNRYVDRKWPGVAEKVEEQLSRSLGKPRQLHPQKPAEPTKP